MKQAYLARASRHRCVCGCACRAPGSYGRGHSRPRRQTAGSDMRNSLNAALLLAATLTGCASSVHPNGAAQIDHVVIGVPNLESAVTEIERLTGVRPVLGGSHPGRGTHNALLSLGHGGYLELIAPQPGAKKTTDNADLSSLKEPTPVDWAVATVAAEPVVASLRALHFDPGAPEAGSRKTPSGGLLQWRTFGLNDALMGAPFFIEWKSGSPHPSTTSPSGCSLVALRIASPDAAALQRLVAGLGLDVGVSLAPVSRITVQLQCPRGRVDFPYAA